VFSRRLSIGGRAAYIGILSEEGLATLRRYGHESLAASCAPGLPADDVRFVDASERPALEGASEAELAARHGAPAPRRPLVVAARAGADRSATLDLRIQPDLACLRGHFAALPVVPGAVQLGWALDFGAEMLGTPPAMRGARSVKFERIIQPGRALSLRLAADEGASTLRFEYACSRGRYSGGRIETADADD
jgi:3-hydroxymyristoyl/3-hydroxydecanoyl-(acyl carrier protein) dehydratase